MPAPTEDPQTPPSEAALILAIATIMSVPNASPSSMLGPLARLLARLGIRPAAVQLSLRIIVRTRRRQTVPPWPSGSGPISTPAVDSEAAWSTTPAFPDPIPAPDQRAARQTRAEEANYRAAFLLRSSARIEKAWRHKRTPAEQARREVQYWALHHQAAANRKERAREVDMAAQAFGPVLGWYSEQDNRVSAECQRANGRNFKATERPLIGWPGTVHPHCRCRAGVPFATSKTVDQAVSPKWLAAHQERIA